MAYGTLTHQTRLEAMRALLARHEPGFPRVLTWKYREPDPEKVCRLPVVIPAQNQKHRVEG